MSLAERFEAFAATLDGYENVDDTLRGSDPKGAKRADYLVRNRGVVIEQKMLLSDPIGKPQKFVNKLMKQGQIVVFGRLSTDVIFANRPDLKRKMILDLARVIDDNVADADKQTRSTRALFDAPEALGIVVLLNEAVTVLSPDIVNYALRNVFGKRDEAGQHRYPANDGGLLISEAHTATVADQFAFPIMSFVNPGSKRSERTREFLDELVEKWCNFNGAALMRLRG